MNVPKECGHVGCQLILSAGCCACLDRRPTTESYIQYVDGRGRRLSGSRQDNYCPYCRVHSLTAQQRSATTVQRTPFAYPTRWPSTAPTIHRSLFASTSQRPPFPRWLPSSSTPPSPPPATNTPKACGHVGCQLGTPEGCCACLDHRPITERYTRYIDGRGWQSSGSRQEMYCPYCRVGYSQISTAVQRPPVISEDRHFPSSQTIRPEFPGQTQLHEPVLPSSLPPANTSLDGCKICLDGPLEALFLPCAHLLSCAPCAIRLFKGQGDVSQREVNGHELISRTTPTLDDQIGFEALDRVGAPNHIKCPLCRTGVRKWIRVYT